MNAYCERVSRKLYQSDVVACPFAEKIYFIENIKAK